MKEAEGNKMFKLCSPPSKSRANLIEKGSSYRFLIIRSSLAREPEFRIIRHQITALRMMA